MSPLGDGHRGYVKTLDQASTPKLLAKQKKPDRDARLGAKLTISATNDYASSTIGSVRGRWRDSAVR